MRIYNGTNSVVDLPYVGDQRISILPHSISGNIGCTNSLLSLIVTAYTQDELCIVVSGPFELNMCAGIPTVVNYTVQTLEEAVARFMPKEEPKPEVEEMSKKHGKIMDPEPFYMVEKEEEAVEECSLDLDDRCETESCSPEEVCGCERSETPEAIDKECGEGLCRGASKLYSAGVTEAKRGKK